jgi:hypothetical protein
MRTTDNKIIAIKGHPYNGREVISILKATGAQKRHCLPCNSEKVAFYIDNDNIIRFNIVDDLLEDGDYVVMSLKEYKDKRDKEMLKTIKDVVQSLQEQIQLDSEIIEIVDK